jgi:hypothetical protein
MNLPLNKAPLHGIYDMHLTLRHALSGSQGPLVGVCAIYKHFSGFGLFLLPNIIHARPTAGTS